jgi:GWxTD domain-containing protein
MEKHIKTLGYIITFLIIAACSSTYNPDIERGSTYKYKPGYPEVRFDAVGFLNEANKPSINIAADIVYSSLVFKTVKDTEQAHIAIAARFINQTHKDSVVHSISKEFTIKKKNKDIINSAKSFTFQRQAAVPAGDYKVYFTVKDLTSKKKITREAQTSIPNPSNESINLTSIRMLSKNMNDSHPKWGPVTTFSVPGRVDSLMFTFQVTNNSSEEPLTVQASLVRFRSDTSVARPIYYSNYSQSSIQYEGINYDDKTVIQKTRRTLRKAGSVFIQFRFAQQPRGDYRFAVHSVKNKNKLYKARDFSVKSTNYPALKTARELAKPLVYLMNDKDYKKMMAISDPDSLKQAVDRFWLKNIGDKNKARDVIKKYYQRVEQANKQFSSYKAGWKTDMGLMYILFGPPWYVYRHVDHMKWSYAYNQEEYDRNFFFYQPKLKSKYYPFVHYLLQRQQGYFTTAYQQRQLWLTGLILQRNL